MPAVLVHGGHRRSVSGCGCGCCRDRDDLPRDRASKIGVQPPRVLSELAGEEMAVAPCDTGRGVAHVAVGPRLADPGVIHEGREAVPRLMEAVPGFQPGGLVGALRAAVNAPRLERHSAPEYE